jgi:hypothetical protein
VPPSLFYTYVNRSVNAGACPMQQASIEGIAPGQGTIILYKSLVKVLANVFW